MNTAKDRKWSKEGNEEDKTPESWNPLPLQPLSKAWFPEMIVRVLLKSEGYSYEHPFTKVLPHHLKTNGEPFMAEPTRDRKCRNPCQVHRKGMNIG